MRFILCLTAAILFSLPSFAQAPARQNEPNCPPEQTDCKPPSKSDIKKANKLYEHADKLQRNGRFLEAIDALDSAIKLNPRNGDYVTLRERIRQQLVTTHISRGNALLKDRKNVEAMAEFRMALAIDPKNAFALQRIEDTLPAYNGPPVAAPLSPVLTVVAESRPAVLRPTPGKREFHFKGTGRGLLEQIATTFGLKPIFDESVQNRPVRMDLEEVDFFTVVREASKLTNVFWVPISSNQILFANDTPALRREYERMVARTFYINNATTAQELNDVVNLMRTIFELRFVSAQPSDNSIVVRGPEAMVDAAARVVETFLERRPQVNLRIQIFQVSHRLTRQLGITLPLSFQAINVPAAALALLGQGNIQDIINQIIASGGINNIDPAVLQGLIAQLQNQQNSTLSSLLQTPFATFGGGSTLFAVPIPPVTANFSLNRSDLQSLSDLTLRTAQNNAATMRIGSRYPILNASFAPVFNSPAISQSILNNTFVPPFPSFTYEDLGIIVKATPQVLSDNTVNLKLELAIKSLTGQMFNSIPVISNREYTGTMSVRDGYPAVIAGILTESEQKTLSGIPGVGRIPFLREVTSNQTKDVSADEVLFVITPYIVSPAPKTAASDEVWLPAS